MRRFSEVDSSHRQRDDRGLGNERQDDRLGRLPRDRVVQINVEKVNPDGVKLNS